MERYRVDKVVGQGSFGQAILCARIRDGKACIVKQVDTSKLPSKARREASKEATLLAKLSHPNIVGFWESFLHGPSRNVLCIVMDYADGGDLSTCLKRRNGRLLEEEVILDWFVQTTLALKHIHDRKILHRDLKTQNIFLTRSRVVKLGDFGIAKVLGGTFDLARTAIGTPYYMSPEICQEKRYNHKTDMWSLGCVLYEMTALRHAFDGSNMRQLAMKICAQDPRPISSRYSSGMRTLIRQLLKKDHHARPSTGAVLRQPLIKDKIGRFLSEAQIKEEFSNGVSPSASPADGLPRPSPPGVVAPGRPLHAGDSGRERALRPSGLNGNHDAAPAVVGRAVAGGGGGRVARAAAVAASKAKERAAEADDRKKALARKKEVRAAAKERGHLAAVALKLAKPSRRLEHDAGAPARKKQREARREEERASDAKRANVRAEAARVALGIGSPRRSFRHDAAERQAAGASPDAGRGRARSSGPPPVEAGRGKASPPPCRPPSRPAAPPQGMGDDVPEAAGGGGGGEGGGGGGGGGANDRVFQRVQNMRGHPSAGAEGAARLVRPDEPGRLAGEEVAVGVRPVPEEADLASELARRWRAARSVFGPGFGGEKKKEPSAPEEQKRDASEVSRSPSRSSSPEDAKNAAADSAPSVAANPVVAPPRKPEAEVSRVPEPKEDAELTKNLKEKESRETTDEAEDIEDDGASPCGGSRGEVLARAEETTPRACAPFDCQGGGGRGGGGDYANGWTDAAEKCEVVDCDSGGYEVVHGSVLADRRSPDPTEVEAGGDGGESKGSAAHSSRVDLGMEDGWFQKLEAKMGAIKKQVDQIKSPAFSTPRRRDESRHSANRHDKASPRSYSNTPPPNGMGRDDHQRYGDRVDKEVDGSTGGERRVLQSSPRQPTCTPPSREAKHRGGEGDEQLFRHSGENAPSTPVVGGNKATPSADGVQGPNGQSAEPVSAAVSSFRPADAASPAALRRCNSQQPRLLAAAAAIEAAVVAVAAIPKIPAENRTPAGKRSGSDGDIRGLPSQHLAKDREANLTENPRGGVSGRARQSPLGNAQIKVVRTPARRLGGGGGGGKPPMPARSERKPPRHAAALAAELERHSDKRPSIKMQDGGRTPSSDAVGGEPHTPSAEERVQTLRAARNRERGELRALIAQRRKASNAAADAGGSPEGSPDGDGLDQVREWSTPSGWAAGSPVPRPRQPGARVAASEPPPRRRFRSPNGVVPSKGALAAGDKGRSPGGGSVDAPNRPRGSGNKDGEDNHKAATKRKTASSSSKVARDPARRNQDLRAFIAESRREHRAKQGDRIDGAVSVWADAGAGGLDDSAEGVQPAAESAAPTPMRTDDDGSVVGARRNIGLDFDEEDKAWEGEGRAAGGALEAQGNASNAETNRESISESKRENSGDGGDGGSGDISTPLPPAIAASLSRRTSNAEDNLAEPSMLEASVVADLHEVLHEKPQGQDVEESVVQEAGSVLLVQDAGEQYPSNDDEDKARSNPNNRSSSNNSSSSSGSGGAKSTGGPSSGAADDADHFSSVSSDKGGEDEGGAVHGNDVDEDEADSEAGVMEGVHPGLATYESQRAAVGGLGGGGGAGLEEYARMLEQMQEVLALGEDASSDSSWGGSTSDEERDSEEALRECGSEKRSTSRSTGSDCGVEEVKEAGGGRGGEGDSSGELSHGSGGSSAEAVLDDASNRRKRGPVNRRQVSQREGKGTGEDGVGFHDNIGDARSEVAGFRRCATGGGVDAVCNAEENPPPPGGKDDKLPRVSDPQGSSSPVSSCSALEYSGSGVSAPRQAVDEPRVGTTPCPRDSVSASGAAGAGILAWVDGNVEVEDHHAMCQSDELRGVALSGTRTTDPDADTDAVGRHMGTTKDGCKTINGGISPFGVAAAAAGTGDGSFFSEREERGEEGELSRPGQAAVMATGGTSGSLPSGSEETAAVYRLDEEESEACVPTRTRGGLSLSGEEGEASLSKAGEESLRDRLRGVIGDDKFLDACRYLREVDVGKDDKEMTFEVERILGGAEHLEHLPDLLRLLAAEKQ